MSVLKMALTQKTGFLIDKLRVCFQTVQTRRISERIFPWKRHTSFDHRVSVSEDGSVAEMELPGFDFGDLNRAGYVEPSKISVQFESSRNNIFGVLLRNNVDGKFEGLANIFALNSQYGYLYFLMTGQYFVKPDFYSNNHYYFPIRWKMGIIHFGETSIQVYQHATSVHTGKTLLEGVSHTILVDPRTRKPTRYPDEFKRSIQIMKNPFVVQRYNPVEIPKDSFQCSYTCQWSDTDVLGHMNHSHYVRICLDAVASAVLDNKSEWADIFRKLIGVNDPAMANIDSLQMLYTAETRPNEELLISCWPDQAKDKPRIHFSVSSKKGPKYFLQLQFNEDKI